VEIMDKPGGNHGLAWWNAWINKVEIMDKPGGNHG